MKSDKNNSGLCYKCRWSSVEQIGFYCGCHETLYFKPILKCSDFIDKNVRGTILQHKSTK